MRKKAPPIALAIGLIGLVVMTWLLFNHPTPTAESADVTTHCVAVIGTDPGVEPSPAPKIGEQWDKPEKSIDADCQLQRNRRIGYAVLIGVLSGTTLATATPYAFRTRAWTKSSR
jgi:hypothetical protein